MKNPLTIEDFFYKILPKSFPNWEHRPQQFLMASTIYRGLIEKKHVIAEAGTGVGKSFAYLIPAILYLHDNGAQITVSTNTITLQEQLLYKDIPFLKEIIPYPFKTVLIKGRNNYICKRRFLRTYNDKDKLIDKKYWHELKYLKKWIDYTEDGTLSDITYDVSDIWPYVCCQSGNCKGKKCDYYNECFFQLSRIKAKDADLLIINHHLFFSNLALIEDEYSFLPLTDVVIFDEAHELENIATKHLGIEFSSNSIYFLLNTLYNKDKDKGFLKYFENVSLYRDVEEIKKSVDNFINFLSELLSTKSNSYSTGQNPTYRLRSPIYDYELALQLENLANNLYQNVKKSVEEDIILEGHTLIKRLRGLSQSIEIFTNLLEEDHIYWIERDYGNKVLLNSAPISIAENLKNLLFSTSVSCVMSSATLSIGDDYTFGYFRRRIGLEEAIYIKTDSPFNYKKQVNFIFISYLKNPIYEDFTKDVSNFLIKFFEIERRGTFVLFTSYKMLEEVYNTTFQILQLYGMKTLRQSAGYSKTKLIESFLSNKNCVLFGTDSFWTGVDIKGEKLSNIIIVKLPFSVPSHPVIEARLEEIELKGGNPFKEYTLPEAIIKFKQGFGRLIRSKTDRGNVIILDKRIITQYYGRAFIKSLPECNYLRFNNEKTFLEWLVSYSKISFE